MSDITWVDYFSEDGEIAAETPEQQASEAQRHADAISELFEEDDFEDADFAPSINSKFPGWYLVRMYGFTWNTMSDIKDWCASNTKFGEWEAVGWSNGCSTSVGVVFESGKDAMMFKLRWR